jgi:uncharacterized membrane protein YphA (DoxX/SURF4 family)
VNRIQEAFKLQRLFSTFPEGLSGLGLLFLRLTVAGTILFLTFFFFSHLVRETFRGWLIAAVSIVFSAAMISGFLTPVISALIFIGGILFLILSPGEMNSFFMIYLVILSLVIILLGPGAYSIDARLFGRREIILSKKN